MKQQQQQQLQHQRQQLQQRQQQHSSNNIQNKDHPNGDTPKWIHQMYYEILMKIYVELLQKKTRPVTSKIDKNN